MEQAMLTGVAHDRSESKITVLGVPDELGKAAHIFRVIADAELNIDMVLQNISHDDTRRTDVTFTLPKLDAPIAVNALRAMQSKIALKTVTSKL